MKVAILRSENRSKVPGETCFDGKYFLETGDGNRIEIFRK